MYRLAYIKVYFLMLFKMVESQEFTAIMGRNYFMYNLLTFFTGIFWFEIMCREWPKSRKKED